MKEIGNELPITRLKKLRLDNAEKYGAKEWTQKAVARKVDATERIYREWEKGTREPETYHLKNLARLFGVSCDYLLDMTEYTNIGNKEISAATGLSNESIDFLRYLNYDGNHYANDDIDKVNHQTIDFLNRVLEHGGRKATRDADGDTKATITMFTSLERYVLSKNAVASIGGTEGKLITFDDEGASLVSTIDPLYQEMLMQLVRKELNFYVDEIGKGGNSNG